MESRRTEIEEDILEIQRLMSQTTNPRVSETLKRAVGTLQDELMLIPAAPAAPPVSVPIAEGTLFRPIEKFAWEQEGKVVKVYITCLASLKSHPAEKIVVEHTRESVDVKILDLAGENHRFVVKQLAKPIADCRLKTSSKGFTLTLKKAEDGHWDNLAFKPSAISKPKAKAAEDDKKDPGSELMNMMREMYENVRVIQGDDEMRRVIGEAWTKSREDKASPKP